MDAQDRWATLPDEVKTRVLEEYKDFNTAGFEWWDSVYESFKEDMRNIGVEVDRMYFSGFWSQGDGACFEGEVKAWELFLPTIGHTPLS